MNSCLPPCLAASFALSSHERANDAALVVSSRSFKKSQRKMMKKEKGNKLTQVTAEKNHTSAFPCSLCGGISVSHSTSATRYLKSKKGNKKLNIFVSVYAEMKERI